MLLAIKSVTFIVCTAMYIAFGACLSVNHQDHKTNSRVIGGNPAPEGAFPFQISLRTTTNSHFCGGALISGRWVLTSANCVYDKLPNQVLIVAGAHSIYDGSIYGCEIITRHPQYNPTTRANDLAVLKTSREVANTTYVAPAFYYGYMYSCGIAGVTTGWGDTQTGGATELQYLNVTTISNWGCKIFLSDYAPADDLVVSTSTLQQICVFGIFNSDSSVCNGDSGAPLFGPTSKTIFGVLSFGSCATKKPAVFTQVGFYEPWIRAQTNVQGVV